MLSNTIVTLKFNSYKKQDLKRKFLFFNRLLFRFVRINAMAYSVQKFNRLISLLRSPFVHKKSFEQFFYSFYNCTFKFFYGGYFNLKISFFVDLFISVSILKKFISKIEVVQKSTFFF